MVDVAQVKMFGRTVGYVSWNRRYGVAQFEYDPDFVKSGIQPSPILMPAREGFVYSFGELNRDTFKGTSRYACRLVAGHLRPGLVRQVACIDRPHQQ